jgi:hypothetical protein
MASRRRLSRRHHGMFGLGVWSFYAMYAAFGVPLRG